MHGKLPSISKISNTAATIVMTTSSGWQSSVEVVRAHRGLQASCDHMVSCAVGEQPVCDWDAEQLL